MRPKILVAEDDHALRDVLRRGLLDEVGLPDADGRDVCQTLRANGFAAPITFLTARHHLAELVAWLRAAAKRAGPPAVAGAGDLLLDDAATAPGTTAVEPVLHRLAEPWRGRTVLDVTEPELAAGVAPALLERIVSPLLANVVRYAPSTVTAGAGQRTDRGDRRRRSSTTSSSPAAALTPATGTMARAWVCRSHGAWPAPSAARCPTVPATHPGHASRSTCLPGDLQPTR